MSTEPAQPGAASSDIDAAERWDLVIRPHEGWLDLHLADIWRYRDLVRLFVRRDFVARFKQTILGPAWFVIQPLLTTAMFVVVFGRIANLSTDGIPHVPFYLAGNILWQYFANCVTATSDTFRTNAHLFGKVYFPRLVVPLAVVVSQMMQLALQFALFLAVVGWYALKPAQVVRPNALVLLFPLLVAIMAALGLGAGIIISAATTKYRDLQYVVQFGVQLLMYATTVIYPLSSINGRWLRPLIQLNPMTPIIETFRRAYLGAGDFGWGQLAYSGVAAVGLLLLGLVLFNRVDRTFMDTV